MRWWPAASLVALGAATACSSGPASTHGLLDLGFGAGGVIQSDPGTGVDTGRAVALDAVGSILVAGKTQNTLLPYAFDFGLSRFDAGGKLDPAFGGGLGSVTVDLGSTGNDQAAESVAVRPDGDIYLAGVVTSANGRAFVGLARLFTDGTVDPTFAGGGTLVSDIVTSNSDDAHPMALAADGGVYLGGATLPLGSHFEDFLLEHVRADGTLDPAFGSGGRAMCDFGSHDSVYALTLDSKGRILAVGGIMAIKLARFLPSGAVDTSFGTGGMVQKAYGGGMEIGIGVAVDAEDRPITLGVDDAGVVTGILARWTTDGKPDPTFGSGTGSLIFQFATDYVGPTGLVLQPDGKIVVVGTFWDGDYQFELQRFLPDGTLDPDFGAAGRTLTRFGSGDYAYSVALQKDGRIVVAGSAQGTLNQDYALARYLP